ncbi:MAG: 4-(cytidine 5'-diphospho)-2-C-methyl-D-erythritol kinase [Longimicrobiales bacterium]
MLAGSANAKINLRLRVLARESSGYHQIETVLCRIDLADRIEVEAGEALALEVSGGDAGRLDHNVVLRAAALFYARAGLPPAAAIRLHKRIPAGTGLGGGSSDAATTLHLLNELHQEPLGTETLLDLAQRIGTDVPFFASHAACALAWGRGERLLALPPPPALPVLVVVPAQRIATAAAYAELAEERAKTNDAPVARLFSLESLSSWEGIRSIACNDFEPVADRQVPALAGMRAALREAGACIAQLTGSGSALFGLFDDESERDRAGRAIASAFPEALIFPTSTVG